MTSRVEIFNIAYDVELIVVPSVRIRVCVLVVGTDIKAFVSWHDLNSLTKFETILSFENADLVVASYF